jgi:hypothetical protein
MKHLRTATLSGDAEINGAVATLVLAFAADPVARWMYRSPDQYLLHIPRLFRALGAGSFEAGAVHRSPNGAGVAIWFPPGVHGDTALVEANCRQRGSRYARRCRRGFRNDRTFPYLSANGLIMFCVNDAHVWTPIRGTVRAASTVWQLGSASVPHSILSPIGLDRVCQKNAGANKRDDGHY